MVPSPFKVAPLLCVMLFSVPAMGDDDGPTREVGLMIWGASYVQLVYRAPVSESLRLELGGLPLPLPGLIGANASAGLAWDLRPGRFWSPLLVAGPAAAFVCAERSSPDETGEERVGLGCTGIAYGHARAGMALNFEGSGRSRLSVEGGLWYGVQGDDFGDAPERSFLWPVGGLAFYLFF